MHAVGGWLASYWEGRGREHAAALKSHWGGRGPRNMPVLSYRMPLEAVEVRDRKQEVERLLGESREAGVVPPPLNPGKLCVHVVLGTPSRVHVPYSLPA